MNLKEQYRGGVRVIFHVLRMPKYFLLTLGLYPLVLWVFVYLSNFNLFVYIFRESGLSASEQIGFVLQTMINVFVYITDPLAASIVIFSLLATLNLTMMVYVLRRRQKVYKRNHAASVLALAGSHCFACGGSLLAPVITALVGSGAYISAARANVVLAIGLGINILAILIILHVTLKLAHNIQER